MTESSHLDLVQEEIRELTDSVIDGNPEQPFGIYAIPSHEPGAQLGRHVEQEVFGEFFGNSPEMLAAEYGAYEPASVFLTVVDHRRRVPAGVMRVVLPSEVGLKSLDDLERAWGQTAADVIERTGVEFDMNRVWDVATLAVADDYRGEKTSGLMSLALYQALTQSSLRCDAGWWIAILDVVVLDLIQTQTQKPFRYFRGIEPIRYLDSPSSVLVWADIPDWRRRIELADPAMHEILVGGSGLESAVLAPDWDRFVEFVGGRPADTSGSAGGRSSESGATPAR